MVLKDRFGRSLTHLRVSVTQRCNHKCIFCHMEGIYEYDLNELSADDWGFLASVAYELGIRYYKITGGEPLIRQDIVDIVRNISKYADEVSITTNGSLLEKYAQGLADAGLSRFNISLHSLNKDVFKEITGGDLERVLNGIKAAVDTGLPVKLDYLVMKINVDEYREIISFAESIGVDLNIIELIPLGLAINDFNKLHTTLDMIKLYLENYAVKKYIRRFQSRPVYVLPSGISVTLISGFCNPELCMSCTRLRVTPDGRLKTCIYRNDNLIDISNAIRNRDREAVKKGFEKANILREPFFKLKK